MVLNNLTLFTTFHLMLLLLACTPGRVWAKNKGNGKTAVSRSFQDRTSVFYCWTPGYFQVPGSCRDFYYCDASSNDLMPLRLTCPPNSVFRGEVNACHPTLPSESTKSECEEINQKVTATARSDTESFIVTENVPIGNRQKRFTESNTMLSGLPSLIPLVKNSVKGKRLILPDLTRIEHRLSGMDARLMGLDLQSFLNRLTNKTKSDITQNLMSGGMENKQFNSNNLRDLGSRGTLETTLHSATTQGLLRREKIANGLNFVKLHANIGDLNQVIAQEIKSVHSEFQKGYSSISHTVDRLVINQLLSNLLTTARLFNERTNLLQSLPDSEMKEEIVRNGGYIEFLESSTLKDKLYNVIDQKLAIPNASDDTSTLLLELVFQGLQIHRSLLMSVVLSNVYLAGKALEEKKLQEFNSYISRVSTATRKMKLELGDRKTHGLIQEVRNLLIQRFNDLTENIDALTDIESNVKEFIMANTPIGEPGQILGMPQFNLSNASLPIGSWETGKKVKYAIQFVSDTGLSKIGEWSQLYTVTDKANPLIHLARAEPGVTRILYRQFIEENSELVAILTDENETVIRDMGRDIINAAARLNYNLGIDEIRVLIADGAYVNVPLENGMSPLHYAAKSGNLLAMQLLVNASADVHAKTLDNEGVLHFAILSGNEEAVSYIINEGVNINTQTRLLGWSPLHIAVANSQADIVQLLIKNKAFMNIRDNSDFSPLHLSVLGNGEIMETLLKEDTVDVNAKAKGGLTSLHYAAQSSNSYYTKRLLKPNVIEVNSVTDHHLSPLHYAAMSGNAEIITDLVTNGASEFLKDNYGSSPLHYAAFYGNKEAALAISERFPDLKAMQNNDGKTPFDIAVENDREEVIQILRNETKYLINLIKEELVLSRAHQPESSGSTPNHSKLSVDNPPLEIIECSQLQAKELGLFSEETCLSIGRISEYISAVTANIPLHVQYEMPKELSEIIESYNNDIQEAKRNANVWRNQNSIRGEIQQTFKTAKDFESTFNMKYDILRERLASIMKNMDEDKIRAELREEMSKLERKLQEAQAVLSAATTPNVKTYLRQSVSSLQLEIENKQSLILIDPSVTYQLQEYVYFLSIVRDDASRIKGQAMTTKWRIREFKEKLKTDITKLLNHKLSIQTSLKILQQQSISHNSELVRIHQRQEDLEAEIEEQKKDRWDLSEETYNAFRAMRNKRRELIEKIGSMRIKDSVRKIIKSMVKLLGQKIRELTGIPVDTMIEGSLLGFADDTDKQLIDEWKNTIEANKIETEKLEKSIKANERLIAEYRRTIANDSMHSEILTRELNTFNRLGYDLQGILTDIPTPQPSVSAALSGVEKVEDVFGKINQELSNMISTAQRNMANETALSSIRNKLSDLHCYWKDASVYIIDLGECS